MVRWIISGGYTDWVADSDRTHALPADRDRFRITSEALDVAAVAALVAVPDCGAVATFVGIVRDRNAGRRVLRLDYECYEPLAVRAFGRIGLEAAEAWPSVRLAIVHRVGTLAIGEASIVIAAASPHRTQAFAACRYAIERVKQIAPIWKREHFDGGEVWIEGATADPADDTARRQAMTRACA